MKIYLSTSASPKENQHASYLNIVNKYTATEVKHHVVYIVKSEFFSNGQSRMDNPETQAILDTCQNEQNERQTKIG